MSQVHWYYYKPPREDAVLIPVKDLRIESLYQEWLKTGKSSGLVYHCFGDGRSAGVDYDRMETFCFSWKCACMHHGKSCTEDHLDFNLVRMTE